MKIAFLNPATNGVNSYPHLGMAFLSSILKKKGHQVVCFDGSAPYRVHTNEDLVNECRKFNPDVICITATTESVKFDDTLMFKKSTVNEICEKIVSCTELSGITWGFNARPNLVDKEFLQNMKDAGCRVITVGVENGDPETLIKIKK